MHGHVAPVKGPGIGGVRGRERREGRALPGEMLSEGEDHEVARVVADIDHEAARARGLLDVSRGLGGFHARELQIGDIFGEPLERLARPVVGRRVQPVTRQPLDAELEPCATAFHENRGRGAAAARHGPRELREPGGAVRAAVVGQPLLDERLDRLSIEREEHVADGETGA